MKVFFYPVLFTLLVIGAVSAQLIVDLEDLLRTEEQLPTYLRDPRTEERLGRELRPEELLLLEPQSDVSQTQMQTQSQPKVQLPNFLSLRIQIRPRPAPSIENPSIDERLEDLLEAQSQLRSEIQKAQLQQQSQIQLDQVPSSDSGSIIGTKTRVLLGQHKPGTVIVITPQ